MLDLKFFMPDLSHKEHRSHQFNLVINQLKLKEMINMVSVKILNFIYDLNNMRNVKAKWVRAAKPHHHEPNLG